MDRRHHLGFKRLAGHQHRVLLNHVAVMTVAYTDRDGAIRIISARPATATERKVHE